MGLEAECTAASAGRSSRGKALLETDEILFRGEFRLKIPLKEITSVTAVDGKLSVRHGNEEVTFTLGPAAEKWATRIRNPKSVLEKLGVKPGLGVLALGAFEEGFLREVRAAGSTLLESAGNGADLLFFFVSGQGDLEGVRSLEPRITRSGAVWIVYPKGRKDLREADVLAAGRAAGFVDVKVARFSQTHTALKFVVPAARR